MLFDMKQKGDLVKNTTDHWIVSKALNWDRLPARIEAAIAERFSHLPSPLLELLKIASVEGERFTVEVLAQIHGVDEAHILTTLREELDEHYQLVQADSSRRTNGHRLTLYRFRHILYQKYLYRQLNAVEREELHEQIGREIEIHYSCILEEKYLTLAIHFELAGLHLKAIQYYELAGRQAIQLISYDDAIVNFNKALAIIENQPTVIDKDQLELKLLMSLSVPLMFKSGFASVELSVVSDRIVELLDRLPLDVELFPIMHTLTQYYGLRAEYDKTFDVLNRAHQLANTSKDELYLRLSDWGYGFLFLLLGKLEDSLLKLENMINFYDYYKHHKLRHNYGNDAGVASRVWSSWTLWLLGFPEKALDRCQEAIELSNRLADPANQLLAQLLSVFVSLLMKNTQIVEKQLRFSGSLLSEYPSALYAEDLKFLSSFFLFQKNEDEASLKSMHDSVLNYQIIGNQSMLSLYFSILAQGYLKLGNPRQASQLIEKAESFIEITGERFYQAEVLRIKGLLFESTGEIQDAEACYFEALQLANQQKGKTLELRAATSLARLWKAQGKIEEAYQTLAEVYNWFTEGFKTTDLVTARALLNALEPQPHSGTVC
jgi:tetratricopeptide (TPR) repeat protein